MNRSAQSQERRTSATYYSWLSMRQRCLNQRNPNFKNYGGRGIRVCERWNRFDNFLADMGSRPRGKTLDRFPNNDGGYEPSNCRWATRKEQAANKRVPKRRAFPLGFIRSDLTSQRFGLLVVTKFSHFVRNGVGYWHCICDCGRAHIARRDHLKNGDTSSCGCCKRLAVRMAVAS